MFVNSESIQDQISRLNQRVSELNNEKAEIRADFDKRIGKHQDTIEKAKLAINDLKVERDKKLTSIDKQIGDIKIEISGQREDLAMLKNLDKDKNKVTIKKTVTKT
jgi:chromosome segregation ATPase